MNWLHEKAGVVSTIDPANYNNSTQNTDYVDISKFSEVLFVVALGAVDSTTDFKLREAQDTGGTGEQDLTGKAMTQLGAADDNKQVVVSVKAEELSNNYRYVRGRLTVGNGTTNIVAVVGLGVPRYAPATDDDLSSVAQVVA